MLPRSPDGHVRTLLLSPGPSFVVSCEGVNSVIGTLKHAHFAFHEGKLHNCCISLVLSRLPETKQSKSASTSHAQSSRVPTPPPWHPLPGFPPNGSPAAGTQVCPCFLPATSKAGWGGLGLSAGHKGSSPSALDGESGFGGASPALSRPTVGCQGEPGKAMKNRGIPDAEVATLAGLLVLRSRQGPSHSPCVARGC